MSNGITGSIDKIHKYIHQSKGLLISLTAEDQYRHINYESVGNCLWLIEDQLNRIKEETDIIFKKSTNQL